MSTDERFPRQTFSRRGLAGFAVAGALLGLWVSPGRAHADQIEYADTKVSTVRVSYVEPINRVGLYVELNNGATYTFRPCTYEDGSGQRGGCFWDAGDRGNNVGQSFVVLPSGKFVYSPKVGNAR